MKTAIVINNTGNVGKTLITREVFAADEKTSIIEVETNNSSNSKFNLKNQFYKFSSSDFTKLYAFAKNQSFNNNTVIDVGSSNIINFLENVQNYKLQDLFFQTIIIPTTSDSKQIEDTITTVYMLKKMGIEISKIFVIFNKATSDNSDLRQFEIIAKASKKLGFNFSENLKIYNSQSIQLTENRCLSISQFLEETKDNLDKFMKSTEDEEIKKYGEIDLMRESLKIVQNNCQAIRKIIWGN